MRPELVLARESLDSHLIVHTDPALYERSGIRIVFTERSGGVSRPPYATLNLAGHVGDEPAAVDANRESLLLGLGLAHLFDRLVTAGQVHGSKMKIVTASQAGAGARLVSGRPPIPGTDVLITSSPAMPLLMLYADCVPVILVTEQPRVTVGVVHAGWRGALASLPGAAANRLAKVAGCSPSGVDAYIGPHIRSCCYEVDGQLASRFRERFGDFIAAHGNLDLTASVVASLTGADVPAERVAFVQECTLEHQERFFSYRASPVTGRHGALAVIEKA